MSGSPEFVEFAGQKASRFMEKSNFSQTCSLLSQYLKENGSFGDLSLGGMTRNAQGTGNGNIPETMNLFPVNEKQVDLSSTTMATSRTNIRSMDLFPQQSGFAPKQEIQKKLDSSVNKAAIPEPQSAQMTIFYGGQVIVFNDFPADKAKEVMNLAGKGSSQNLTGLPSAAVKSLPSVFAPIAAAAKPTPESTSSLPPTPIGVPNLSNNIQSPHQSITSDLPIARRASLHRFLEKRKDRITSRAPYQMSGYSAVPPSKPAENNKPWLGLAAQSLQ